MKRILIGAVCLGLLCPAAVPAAGGVAMVVGIYGGLDIQRGGSHVPAKIRTLLQAGDVVKTDDRSRAVLLLADGSQIKLSTDTTVQISPSKGIKVVDGEIFAHMSPQHGAFTFSVPHGRLGVVGTELDVKVAHASLDSSRNEVTTLTVAKGSVDFYGGAKVARAVRVAAGSQSTLAMKDTSGTSAEAALEPSPPVQVDVDPIVAWQAQVQQYSEVIGRMAQQFQLLEADTKAHEGFISPTLMQQVNDDEDLIRSLVPDDDFVAGHQDLILAFENFKMSLSMTANPELAAQSREKAEAAYQAAQMAFQIYKAKYQQKMGGFLHL